MTRSQSELDEAHAGVTPMRAALLGARDTAPLLPGVVPFGLIYGATALAAGLPAWLAQAMSAIIFAGSAQFAVVLLVSGGASALVLVLTAATLNLRHLLYSASIGPTVRGGPRGWRLALAYLLTDEVYGVVIGRMMSMPMRPRLRYMLGSGLTLWGSWQISTLVGILIGARIPASWSLDFAATLTFIALVVPLLRDRALIGAALVAGIVAALTLGAPLKLGLALAALAGIVAGIALDRWLPSHDAKTDTMMDASLTDPSAADPATPSGVAPEEG
ncbi:MAG TPA: AzlC family ABC transporter permease [Ktedonobacterales bacterium]|jgi:predicted branched-subunit amino acid permease|nr:AzlC family ABC transporter permease [Ktedonobacterales bacterium]